MANGAAGCGLEYGSTTQGTCPLLDHHNQSGKFSCLRHHTELETHRVTGHPFRCTACVKSANPQGPNTLYTCWGN
jgi:hypothetical protein